MGVLVKSLDQFVEAEARLCETSRLRAAPHRLNQGHRGWILRAVRGTHGTPLILVLYAPRALASQQAIKALIWGSYSDGWQSKLDWTGVHLLRRQPHGEIR